MIQFLISKKEMALQQDPPYFSFLFFFFFSFFLIFFSFCLQFWHLRPCLSPHLILARQISDTVFSRVLRDSTPRFVGPSVRGSVRRSVRRSVGHTLLFLGFWDFWLQCSCPNDLVTSITAPAHPHATGVAVYPALFLRFFIKISIIFA